MALADSLAEQLNEAHQTIQSLQEAKQHKDEEEEEKRMVNNLITFSRKLSLTHFRLSIVLLSNN